MSKNYLNLENYSEKYKLFVPYVKTLCRNGTLNSYVDDAGELWIEDSYISSLPDGYVLLYSYAAAHDLDPSQLYCRAIRGTLFLLYFDSHWYINPDTMYNFGPKGYMLLSRYVKTSKYCYNTIYHLCVDKIIPSVLVGKYRFISGDADKRVALAMAKTMYEKHNLLFSRFKDNFFSFDPLFSGKVEVSCIDFRYSEIEFMLSSGHFFYVAKHSGATDQDVIQELAAIKDQIGDEVTQDEDLLKKIIKAVNEIELEL